MALENINLINIELTEIIKALAILLLGIFLAVSIKFVLNRVFSKLVYPSIRRNSPKSYKKSTEWIQATIFSLQWLIVVFFIFLALSVFNIEILNLLAIKIIEIMPRITVSLIILAIGLILASVISKNIKSTNFKNNTIVAKIAEIFLVSATVLSSTEALGIRLTAFLRIFEISLFAIALIVGIGLGIGVGFALKPEIMKIIKELRNE